MVLDSVQGKLNYDLLLSNLFIGTFGKWPPNHHSCVNLHMQFKGLPHEVT
ncbi:hypothetical protein BVRB_1g019030 [Beta vulgaris subsp. vulgaris]|nr:hypothetical protein BVRB_1g019030 [Beta vulgaris subsp. vulgaris]